MNDEFPFRLSPFYEMAAPNDPILLYRGPAKFRADEHEFDVEELELCFRWLPSIGAEFRFEISTPDESSAVSMFSLDFGRCVIDLLKDPKGTIEGHVRKTKVNSAVLSIEGWIDQWPEQWEHVEVQQLVFHVCNFMNFYGNVTLLEDGSTCRSRVSIAITDFVIDLDAILTKSEYDELNYSSGYRITHVGRMTRSDERAFTLADVDSIKSALCTSLSFLNGRRCGPILCMGIAESEMPVTYDWRATRTAPCKSVSRWLNDQLMQDAVPLTQRLHDLSENEVWSESLTTAIYWYLEANSGTVESQIVFTQLAFEGLFETLIVDDRGLVTSKGADKLRAEDKTRLMLGICEIPVTIPLELVELCSVGRANNFDGVTALTTIRNALVHPTKKNRSQLLRQKIDSTVERQAAKLSLYWLELILLHVLNYNGRVYSRLTPGPSWELETVPWTA